MKLVSSKLKVRTLSVGDGANDVSMIQTANVGYHNDFRSCGDYILLKSEARAHGAILELELVAKRVCRQ